MSISEGPHTASTVTNTYSWHMTTAKLFDTVLHHQIFTCICMRKECLCYVCRCPCGLSASTLCKIVCAIGMQQTGPCMCEVGKFFLMSKTCADKSQVRGVSLLTHLQPVPVEESKTLHTMWYWAAWAVLLLFIYIKPSLNSYHDFCVAHYHIRIWEFMCMPLHL